MKPHHQPLQVALRIRPMNSDEHNTGAKQIAHTVDKKLVVLLDPNEDSDDILRANRSREKKYIFDHTFGPRTCQLDIYQHTTSGLISYVTSGYNATVFAYGPTGAGKTYTMLGTDRQPGIMVLTLNDLFLRIKVTQEDMIYRVTMSYLEIYNEMIRDLLDPSRGILELREDSSGAVVVAGLLEVETTSTLEVMRLLSLGNKRRTSEPTAVNKTSSRSHAILKVTVEQRSRVMNVTQEVRTGVLFMVDLAGSERAAITQNRGKRMIEGAHINRSLLALGNCINALGGNTRANYVNYRDSKLTRLLKYSLGGNCRTVMIAHVSPASSSFEESRNTLTYAERAKRIKTKVHQNVHDVSYHVTQYHKVIAELRRKVQRLQEQLAQAHGGTEGNPTKVSELCLQMKELSEEEKKVRQETLVIECHLLQNALESQRHLTFIHEWEQQKRSPSNPSRSPPSRDGVQPTNENPPPYPREEPHATLNSSADVPPLMEPLDVASSREELATLVADKQRMEAQHKRLQRHLGEVRTRMTEVQEKFSGSSGLFLPLHKELFDLLQRSCDLETTSLEHALSAALAGIQLVRREDTIEQLLQQGGMLLEVLEQQRALMEEHHVPLPMDVSIRYQQVATQQKKLASQVSAEKQLPLIGRELQLPTIARLSAKLCTTMTGSKSNLLVEDVLTEEAETSRGHTPLSPIPISDLGDIRLPSIADSPLPQDPLSTSHSLKPPSPASSPLTLPPVSPTKSPSLVTTGQDGVENHTQKEEHQSSGSTVTSSSLEVKTSETVTAVDPATANPISVSRGIESSLGILSKVSSFTNPRILVSRCSTNKSKYIVLPLSSRHVGDTLIDLEGGEKMVATQASKPSPRFCISQSQPQLGAAAKLASLNTSSRACIKGSTQSFSKPVLSEAIQRRLRDSRTVVTVDELETRCPPNLSTNRTGSKFVHTGSRKQVDVPVAKRIGGGGGVRTRRDAPSRKKPVPSLPKKILLRQELPLAKVTADSHFSSIASPYLTSMRHKNTGPARAKRAANLSATWSLQKAKGKPSTKAPKPKR